MNHTIDNLLQLRSLEAESGKEPTAKVQVEELRKAIPVHILKQYDRLRARGRSGVAFVRRGVCGQCHMQVSIGLLATLRRLDGIHCCQNCGAYLSVVEDDPVELPLKKAKPARRVTEPRPRVARLKAVEQPTA
jgi:predicted  nucleic acid-binding Zn-ribbon protein